MKQVFVFVLAVCSWLSATADTNDFTRFEFQRAEMGMPFRIVLFTTNQPAADSAAEAAFERIKQLNDIMSDYDPGSELSGLSATSGSGKAVPVSPDLWFVLNRAEDLARRSHGSFDVTVGP